MTTKITSNRRAHWGIKTNDNVALSFVFPFIWTTHDLAAQNPVGGLNRTPRALRILQVSCNCAQKALYR
jgi:hypothetical protein